MHSTGRHSFVSRSVRALARLWARLGFTVGQTLAFVGGVIAFAGAVAVLGGVTEDVTRHNGVSTTDPLHLRWFIDHRSSAVDTTARILSGFGSPRALALVAIAGALILWFTGKKVLFAIAPGVALAIAASGAAFGKLIVGRNRPPVSLHLVSESDPSFPSGHATNTTAVLVTLALLLAVYVLRRPLVRVAVVFAAFMVSAAVGISRLVLGVHWPTDVVAGWALGTAVALAVTLAVSVAVRVVPGDPEPTMKRNPLQRAVQVLHLERRSSSLEAA
jgi:undecaprenyl-diphosphatase